MVSSTLPNSLNPVNQTAECGLEKHLGNLKRQGLITDWSDRDIDAGKEWAKEVDSNLNGRTALSGGGFIETLSHALPLDSPSQTVNPPGIYKYRALRAEIERTLSGAHIKITKDGVKPAVRAMVESIGRAMNVLFIG